MILLAIVLIAAWPEVMSAWALMGQVDLWILALLIPVQFLSYYATGGMIFSYLRSKGNLKEQSHWFTTRLALELNFVNHILPSGGAAGFSYLAWILSKFKVSVSRSTMSQIIRFVMTFISFIVLLIVAIIILAFTGHLEHITIFIAIGLAAAAIGGIFILVWLIKSNERLRNFSAWLTKTINRFIRWITRGKKRKVVKEEVFLEFFGGLHDDFLALRRDRKTLIVPFIWALIANMLDVALIWISFWALGFAVDPALLFVAFGVASIAGAVSVTPGGAGVYEAVMVAFLASSGIPPDVAIAGTLLARVTLLGGTIAFGYVFYQLRVNQYGKRPANS